MTSPRMPARIIRSTKPTPEQRLAAWGMAFPVVLETMIKESHQPNPEIPRLDLIDTAAVIAASLIIGAEVGDERGN